MDPTTSGELGVRLYERNKGSSKIMATGYEDTLSIEIQEETSMRFYEFQNVLGTADNPRRVRPDTILINQNGHGNFESDMYTIPPDVVEVLADLEVSIAV